MTLRFSILPALMIALGFAASCSAAVVERARAGTDRAGAPSVGFREAPVDMTSQMSEAILSGGPLYYELDHEVGAELVRDLPKFDLTDEADLRILGAMTQHLPDTFAGDLDRALKNPQGDLAGIARQIEAAYRQAGADLSPLVREQSILALDALGAGHIDDAQADAAKRYFQKVGMFGPAVQLFSERFVAAVKRLHAAEDEEARQAALAHAGRHAEDLRGLDASDVAFYSAVEVPEPFRHLDARGRKELALEVARFSNAKSEQERDRIAAGIGKRFMGTVPAAAAIGAYSAAAHLEIVPPSPVAPKLEAPDLTPPDLKLAKEMFGQTVDPSKLAHVLAAALRIKYPDRKFEVHMNFEQVGVFDESIKRYIFTAPISLSAADAHITVTFGYPQWGEMESLVFLRKALLPYGIPIQAMPAPYQFHFWLGKKVLTPQEAWNLSTN